MTDLAERGSLGVRELQPPLQLGLQDAIFGGQIFNPRQQLLVHPPRDEGQNGAPNPFVLHASRFAIACPRNRSQRRPARLRRERTTHRLFYSSNFLTKVCCRDTCKGVRQCECEICVVKLRERWGRAPRDRLSGAGPKPLQAAAVKSRGGERWSESSRKTLGR